MDYAAIMHRIVSLVTQFGNRSTAEYDERLVQPAETLQEYIHLVETVVHQRRAIVQSDPRTPSYAGDVITFVHEHYVTTNQTLPTITIAGDPESIMALLLEVTGTVEGIPVRTWRSVMTTLTIWLLLHDRLYAYLQHMATIFQQQPHEQLGHQDVRRVLGAHLLLSFEEAVPRVASQPDVPWQWQEPLVMASYVEVLHDTAAFDAVYAAVANPPTPQR